MKASRAMWASGQQVSLGPSSISLAPVTSLANLEHLVDFPGDDAAGESAPAPFHDAYQHLGHVISLDSCPGHGGSHHHIGHAHFAGETAAA